MFSIAQSPVAFRQIPQPFHKLAMWCKFATAIKKIVAGTGRRGWRRPRMRVKMPSPLIESAGDFWNSRSIKGSNARNKRNFEEPGLGAGVA